MRDDDERQADVYVDPRTGNTVTGPGAALMRERDAQTRAPQRGGEEELIRLLTLAVIDNDEPERARLESLIIRRRLARNVAPILPPYVRQGARDTAREAFDKLDADARTGRRLDAGVA